MGHLGSPPAFPLACAAVYPCVDSVLAHVPGPRQGYLQGVVLFLARPGTPEWGFGHRAAPAMVQRYFGQGADAALQQPQPLFVIGNGAWEFHLIG